MKKRKRIILFGILLGIIAATWILRPRPALIWHTTPPLTNGDDILRVRLLVPRDYDLSNLSGFSIERNVGAYGLRPRDGLPRRSGIEITAIRRAVPVHGDASIHILQRGNSVYSAGRYVGDHPSVSVNYRTYDKQEFDSNYEPILNSAKVIRIAESGKSVRRFLGAKEPRLDSVTEWLSLTTVRLNQRKVWLDSAAERLTCKKAWLNLI